MRALRRPDANGTPKLQPVTSVAAAIGAARSSSKSGIGGERAGWALPAEAEPAVPAPEEGADQRLAQEMPERSFPCHFKPQACCRTGRPMAWSSATAK
jgi:hypothetical protein